MDQKIITINRKAKHDYEIIEKFEAGISLTGSEIKSIREGKVNLKDSFIDIKKLEAFLINAHIGLYSNASYNNHEPLRTRKLLLHKREIRKLEKKVKNRGLTIIPIKMYFNKKGRAKVEIALAKGRHSYDKKQKLKERDIKREVERELKNYR